jgi:Mg2+-importing ATPase
VALAVGLSPELLPAIVSVTLSQGARRMAQRGTLVRRLQAIENLGGIDVLCTDKTGTLTEGRVALQSAFNVDGHPDARVLQHAWTNASLQAGIENPLDAAICEAGRERGLTHDTQRRIAEMPYDFARRRLSIVVGNEADPSRHCLITKGAVDAVLQVCTRVRLSSGEVELDAALRARIEADCAQRGLEGSRLLALATAVRAAQPHWGPQDETQLVLEGFLAFLDPPRADAAASMQALRASGVRIVLITGDNRWVAASLARHVDLDTQQLLCGPDLAILDDAALAQRVVHTDVYAQIDPLQKARIVNALQRQGHTVGFLGDGINDVAALHAADVGISVQSAVDIARERADVVLTRPDLGVLHEGILEGRRTFANTLKYVAITTSANFGNMVSMAVATPLLPFLPLAVTQILLNTFLSDLPSMALASALASMGPRPKSSPLACSSTTRSPSASSGHPTGSARRGPEAPLGGSAMPRGSGKRPCPSPARAHVPSRAVSNSFG